MKTHYPHPYVPRHKSTIHRIWREERRTKNPIKTPMVEEKIYIGTFVEYTYTNNKGKRVYVEEFCLRVEWREE